MIKLLVYGLIIGLFVLDWLYLEHGIGIRQMMWLPEVVSMCVLVMIPVKTALDKQVIIPAKYMILIVIYIIHLIFGYLLNGVNGWIILSGTRIYAKWIPIFLVPFVFQFSEKEFRRIFLFIFILSVLQFPVVLVQRFILFAGDISGDRMGGTLGHSASGILAIYLLSAVGFLLVFYLREQISFRRFVFLFSAFFIPITLNETKISFVLLPIVFLVSAIFIGNKRNSIVRIFVMLALLGVAFVVLKGIYNHFQQKRWGYGIETFIITPGRLEEYSRLRLDPIKYAITHAAVKDVRFMVLGHGAGNASKGFIRRLSGEYLSERLRYGFSNVTFPVLIWEIGVVGTLIFFAMIFFIAYDAIRMIPSQSFAGTLSLGQLNFSIFFFLSLFYTHTLDANVLVYLFFLLGGYVATQRANPSELYEVDPFFTPRLAPYS